MVLFEGVNKTILERVYFKKKDLRNFVVIVIISFG